MSCCPQPGVTLPALGKEVHLGSRAGEGCGGSQLHAFHLHHCLDYLGDFGRASYWGTPSYCGHPQPGARNKNPQGCQLLVPPVCQAPGQASLAGCPKSLLCLVVRHCIVVPVTVEETKAQREQQGLI